MSWLDVIIYLLFVTFVGLVIGLGYLLWHLPTPPPMTDEQSHRATEIIILAALVATI